MTFTPVTTLTAGFDHELIAPFIEKYDNKIIVVIIHADAAIS